MRTALLAIALFAASPAAAGDFVVCDNGLRCIMAPCPSTNVLDVKTRKLHRGVSADASRLSPADRAAVERRNGFYEATLVFSGRIVKRQLQGPAGSRPGQVLVPQRVERASTAAERRLCRR